MATRKHAGASETYVLYQPTKRLGKALGFLDRPLPIRASEAPRIFPDSGVQLPALLHEVESVVADHPELVEPYRDVIAELAHLAGMRAVSAKFLEGAIHCFETGIAYRPRDVRLHLGLALALQLNGDHKSAKKEYDLVLVSGAAATRIPVWILAAKNEAALRNYKQAYAHLQSVAPFMTRDDGFWDLIAEYRAKAGIKHADRPWTPTAKTAPKPTHATKTLAGPACASCRAALRPGAKFCGRCGAPAPVGRPCPSCGSTMPTGARFCPDCGKGSCAACGADAPKKSRFCPSCGEALGAA